MKFIFPFFFLSLSACQNNHSVRVIYPDKVYQSIQWSQKEQQQEIAIRHLHRSKTASTHIIRLMGKEFPHYHDHHDLNVNVLSGQSTIHFENHDVKLNPGDVIFIPKGTYHWAENTGVDASIVFATFSPGFDGKDRREAK